MKKLFFFQRFLKYQMCRLFANLPNILNSIDLSFLTKEQKRFREIELGEKEAFNALNSMPNNRSPRDRRLKSRVLRCIWEQGKKSPLKIICQAKTYKEFYTLRKQFVIKCLSKKDRDKVLMKNWIQLLC